MTHTSRAFGMSSGGFDRRVRPDRRRADRRRLSIAVPVDRRAVNDRRINQGRRITEWFAPPESGEQPSIQVLKRTKEQTDRQLATLQPGRRDDRNGRSRSRDGAKPRQGPGFDSITFSHSGRQYLVDAVEMSNGPRGEPVWHWRIAVDGVVEHTLRALPHEDPESLERRAIRTLEETGAGAVRGLDFEFEGRLYHLEDRSDTLSRDSFGDTAMWCITCDGVMEGSFPAPSDETEAVLRARAIQIARRSGEYRARLNTKRERTSRGVPRNTARPPRPRRSAPPQNEQPSVANRPARPTQPRIKPALGTSTPPVVEVRSKKPAGELPITPLDKLIVTSPTPTLNRDLPPILPLAIESASHETGREPKPSDKTQPVRASNPQPRISQPAPAAEPADTIHSPVRESGAQPRISQPARTSGMDQSVTEPVRTSAPLPQSSEPVRMSGPRPRTSQPMRTSGARPRTSNPRISQPSIIPSRPARPKRRGGAWKAIMAVYAVVAAIVLMPTRAFRKPVARNRGSKQIRTAQEWLDATPLRMLFPYAIGATILLGVFPFVVNLWVAAGITVAGLLTFRRRKRTEAFQIQRHRFERHPAYAPRVEVHTGHPHAEPLVATRRRPTTPQRILQSANRP